MQILIITGPPYSGKGTQCEALKAQLGFEHISTGERIRLEKANTSEIGKQLAVYEEKGELVPDKMMKDLFSKILEENKDNAGVILDGYPRSIKQVDDLLELVASKGLSIEKAIHIEVPKAELLKRASKRAETSNRVDDMDSEIHIKRIEVYERSTKPAVEYMKSKIEVFTFDGLGTVEELTRKIAASL